MAEIDDDLFAIEVDADDYARTAAADTGSVSRTHQSEAAFRAEKASYTAKIDGAPGNNYQELLEAVPVLAQAGILDGADRSENKVKLRKKDIQLLGYVVGELYYDHEFATIITLCARVRTVCDFDDKVEHSLDRWERRCRERMEESAAKESPPGLLDPFPPDPEQTTCGTSVGSAPAGVLLGRPGRSLRGLHDFATEESRDCTTITIMPAPKIDCATSILYGVFASEKSYLVGIRNLVKREHTNMLVAKISEGRLPQELADMIEYHLLQAEQETVIAQWRKGTSRKGRLDKFSYHGPETMAEGTVFATLQTLGVIVTPISNDRPYASTTAHLDTAHYVHLSATKSRPAVNIQLPSRSIVSQLPRPSQAFRSLQYFTPRGGFLAACGTLITRYVFRNQSLKMDRVTYFPTVKGSGGRAPSHTSRLLLCENVMEAMHGWDDEALRDCVALLDLCIIPFDEDEPLKPGLHIWQQIGEVA